MFCFGWGGGRGRAEIAQVTGYDIKREGSFPGRARNLFLCHCVHTGYEIHKDSYPEGTGDAFSGVKQLEY